MRQRIEVNVTTPSTSYKIKILSVHQVDNQLVVVTKVTSPKGMAGASICSERDFVVVKTDAKAQLPVVHYLTGIEKKAGDNHIGNYGRRYNLDRGNSTIFLPIADVSEISHLLSKGKPLYAPRSDGMMALRMDRYEAARVNAAQTPALVVAGDYPGKATFSAEQMRAVLNLHTVVDDGTIKVVFEGIYQEDKNKRYKRMEDICHTVEQKLENAGFSLEYDFLMTPDDYFNFDAVCADVNTKFVTSAVEFSIPAKDPKTVLNFMLLVDSIIAEAKEKSGYQDPYNHVQVSQQSILSCFDDLFISSQPSHYSREKMHCIENEMTITIEDFLNKPGTIHEPASVAEHLLESVTNCKNLPEYAALQDFLNTYYKPFGFDIINNPDKYLEEMLGVRVDELYGDAPIEQKLEITDELEKSLLDENTFNSLQFFITEFKMRAMIELIKPALGAIAHDGGQYRNSYTEFDLLLNAKFCIRDDGRMSIELKDNAGYQRHYSKTSRNYVICDAEFQHLATVLNLEFAQDTDFHKEMIFTPASTLKLKALGLHINETSLRQQMARMQRSSVADSAFALFAPKAVAKTEHAEVILENHAEETKKRKQK